MRPMVSVKKNGEPVGRTEQKSMVRTCHSRSVSNLPLRVLIPTRFFLSQLEIVFSDTTHTSNYSRNPHNVTLPANGVSGADSCSSTGVAFPLPCTSSGYRRERHSSSTLLICTFSLALNPPPLMVPNGCLSMDLPHYRQILPSVSIHSPSSRTHDRQAQCM